MLEALQVVGDEHDGPLGEVRSYLAFLGFSILVFFFNGFFIILNFH